MSTPIEHLDIPLGERHPPHNWEYADATEREGATGFTPDDVGGQALQLDDFSRWTLIDDDPPTWQSDTAVGGTGGVGDVVGPGSATDNALVRFDSTTGKLIQNSAVTLDDDGAITVPEMTAPTTPAAGKVAVYAKSDGLLYSKDDSGTETLVSGGAGGGGGGAYAGVTTGGTGSLDFAQGTKTADEPFIDGSVTWNAGGVTFTAFKLSITDTASVAGSKLVDLLVGGASVFTVGKAGNVSVPAGSTSTLALRNINDTDTGFFFGGSDQMDFQTGGSVRARLSNTLLELFSGVDLRINGSQVYRWVSSTRLLAPSNGQLRIEGNSNGQGDRLIFGTVDTSGAMIKRNSTRLEAKLGGDSAYTQFTCEKLGVNNSAAATTPGTVTKKMEVFDAAGASLGFVAIYDAIT